MSFLRVRNLTLSFARASVVRDLSFDVQRGETLAVVGESGSGKSMSALAMMRLLPRDCRVAGSIHLDDIELTRLSAGEMRRHRGRDLAMIFQEPMTSLNPVLSIGSQIIEAIRAHEPVSAAAARKRAVELLELVNVPDPHRRVDEYPHRFSGGMRQRVMIAMAVACRPRLMIADEPTTALDVTIQAQVLGLLDRLRREMNMALILITHDLRVVAQWADRVIVMYAGRKVEEGNPRDVFVQAAHPYTQGLLSASPRMDEGAVHYRDGRLTELPGNIASAMLEPGCPFVPRCPIAELSCREAMPAPISWKGRTVACHRVFEPGSNTDALDQ